MESVPPDPPLPDPPNGRTPVFRLTLAVMASVARQAEVEFEWAWSVVQRLKHFDATDQTLAQDLLSFQYRVVEAIVELESYRRAVRAELKRLRCEGRRYRPAWLKHRRAALDRYETSLKALLALGRAIGDGFAWWFYEKDRRLIDEHLKFPKQADIPTGIGGFGERLMVRALPHLGGKIAIYHGTTTFLRVGDVSFVELPSRRVHAIGELKTKKISAGEYRLMLHLVSPNAEMVPHVETTLGMGSRHLVDDEPLRDVIRERLEVQKQRMGKAVSNARDKKAKSRLGQPGVFYFEALAEVVRGATSRQFTYVQAGPALVIGAVRRGKGQSFTTDLRASKLDLSRLAADIPTWAMKIMRPERSDNAIIVGTPGSGDAELTVAAASLPLAWWPMDVEALTDILFGRVMLCSLYNPAPLRAEMEALGFSVSPEGDAIHRDEGARRLSINAFKHFDRMTAEMFMSTESVVDMIQASIDAALAQATNGSVRVSIHAQVTTGEDAHEADIRS